MLVDGVSTEDQNLPDECLQGYRYVLPNVDAGTTVSVETTGGGGLDADVVVAVGRVPSSEDFVCFSHSFRQCNHASEEVQVGGSAPSPVYVLTLNARQDFDGLAITATAHTPTESSANAPSSSPSASPTAPNAASPSIEEGPSCQFFAVICIALVYVGWLIDIARSLFWRDP